MQFGVTRADSCQWAEWKGNVVVDRKGGAGGGS